MTFEQIAAILAQYGVLGLFALWYYKVEKPRIDAREAKREEDRSAREKKQEEDRAARDLLRDQTSAARELERDKIQAERLKDQIDENRMQRREAVEREDRIRKDHKEAWERSYMQWEQMINRVSASIDHITERTENNFGLLVALGENQGMTKHNMIARTQSIVGREIDQPNIDTKGDS